MDERDDLPPPLSRLGDFLIDLWRPQNEELLSPDQIEALIRGSLPTGPAQKGHFFHRYAITTHPAWKEWKVGVPGHRGYLGCAYQHLRQDFWWCTSLQSAQEHYSWTNGSSTTFTSLSSQLQHAIATSNDPLAQSTSLLIFDWGNVAKKSNDRSRLWVMNFGSSGQLTTAIEQATQSLIGRAPHALHLFGGLFLMNSAMTKVYAAADQTANSIIYDGRVGAALGLLTRIHLAATGSNSVPTHLQFPWGPSRGAPNRNPSSGSFSFPMLYRKDDRFRAEYSAKANELVAYMRQRLSSRQPPAPTARDIEKALFMIGYAV